MRIKYRLPNTTLSWTIEPASNPIIISFLLMSFITTAFLTLIITNSPFYMRLSVILISFCFGVGLVIIGVSWFFLSLVIMFLGGIMVVFVYASSLGRNFVIKFSTGVTRLLISLGLILAGATYIVKLETSLISQPLSFVYSFPSFIMISLLGMILLSILFVVSKLVTINEGAIKL